MTRRRHALVLTAIVLVAAALRLFALGRDGLWTDEATTVVLAQRPLPQLVEALRADVQAPLHYLLAKAWLALLGDDEWSPRLLSALAGVATVALCGLLGRPRVGDAGSLLAATLLAVQPLHVAASREARAYALLGLLGLLAFVAVDALRRQPTWPRVALAGLAVAALPLTHGLGALQAAVIALAAALPARHEPADWRRAALPKLAAAATLAVALAAPWLVATAGQGAHARVAYAWAQPAWDASFPWQVPLSLWVLAPGVSAPERALWHGPDAWDFLGLIVVAHALARFRHREVRRALPDPRWPPRLALAILGSLAAVFGASLALGPLHVVGRVEVALAPLAALLLGSAASGHRHVALAMGLVVVAISVRPLHPVLARDTRSFERTLARVVAEGADAGDVVVALGAYRFPVEHYVRRASPAIRVLGFPEDAEAHPSWIDWSAHGPPRLRREAEALAERLASELRADGGDEAWLVAVETPGTAPLREALEARFDRTGRWRAPAGGPSVETWRLTERDSHAPARP